MKKLREFTGDRLEEIASGLKSHGIHEKHMAYLAGPEQAVRRITGSHDLTALMDETIGGNGILPAWISVDDQASPDQCGWIRREFVGALQDAGLPCPDTLLNAPSPSQGAQVGPYWVRPHIGRNQISLGNASTFLADPAFGSSGDWSSISAWREALIDAVDHQEIAAGSWGSDRDEQLLNHADIRTWCARRGHVWPIPELCPQPATSTEVQERHATLLADNARLQSEVARLSERLVGKNREISRLEQTIVRQTLRADAQQEALENSLAEARREVDRAALTPTGPVASPPSTDGVSIQLPHVTKGLVGLFDVMRKHWTNYSKDTPPKSSNIAAAIDTALGYKKQKGGEPSRNGQTLAALIRPDEEREADQRVTKRK